MVPATTPGTLARQGLGTPYCRPAALAPAGRAGCGAGPDKVGVRAWAWWTGWAAGVTSSCSCQQVALSPPRHSCQWIQGSSSWLEDLQGGRPGRPMLPPVSTTGAGVGLTVLGLAGPAVGTAWLASWALSPASPSSCANLPPAPGICLLQALCRGGGRAEGAGMGRGTAALQVGMTVWSF